MIVLNFTSGPHAGHQVELDIESISIGRDPKGTLVLQDDRSSWKHCQIVKEGRLWTVTDLGSSNGTCLNGEKLPAHKPLQLQVGDVVMVGGSEIAVRFEEEVPSYAVASLARSLDGQSVLVLNVAAGPLRGQAIKAAGATLSVGSDASGDIVLPDEELPPLVASLVWNGDHCDLHRKSDSADIRLYGGIVMRPVPLAPGALLQIGRHVMEVGYESLAGHTHTATISLSDADRDRLALSIESFADVLRKNSGGDATVEISMKDRWDISINTGSIPTGDGLLPPSDATTSMSVQEHEGLREAIDRYRLNLAAGGAAADALSAAASELRAAQAGPAAAPSSHTTEMSLDAYNKMVEEVAAARMGAPRNKAVASAAQPSAHGSDYNPTQAWEGVTDEAFLVEREDTSTEPVLVPDRFRLRAKLVFLSGPHEQRKVYLGNHKVGLGRASDNFVPLADGMVSRYHAEVVPDGDAYALMVRPEARNKPTVNGVFVETKQKLYHRDLISIGTNIIEFRSSGIDPKTEDATRTVMLPQPRYAFLGQVLVQWAVTLGRDPGSDVFLDHESVERQHAEVQFFDGGFRVLDKSKWGTFVNHRRVVDADLNDGDVIQIGGFHVTTRIEGLRCSFDVAIPDYAFDIPEFVPDVDSGAPEKVLYRKALTAEDDAVREPGKAGPSEKKKKKKSLTWVPPRDVRRQTLFPVVVISAVLLVVGVSAWAAMDRNEMYLSQPLSRAHDSEEFEKWSDTKLGTAASCTACHKPFGGAVSDACVECHTDQHPRVQHRKAVEAGKIELDCLTCHTEHRGEERHTALLMGEACVDCHTDRHKKLLAVTPGPIELDPPALERDDLPKGVKVTLRGDVSVNELHKVHTHIERRCAGCHANKNQTGPVDAGTSCLRCHGEQDNLASNQCNLCHGEHKASMDRVASVGGLMFGQPGSWSGAGILALLLLLPLGVVVAFHQTVRRLAERRAERLAREEEEKAKAVNSAEGKLVHNINIDKCVGCASCVNACPNDVLALEPTRHKSTVVRFDDCKQCRACEQICPSGALTMAPAGAPPRMVELPDLDANYMTNIPGIYLIGEASGKSLVKNANNLGRRVIEHMMVEGVRPGSAAAAGVDVEVVAVGSGPGGLSVGISAFTRGLKHIVFEKDRKFSSTIQTYPKGKELLAEPPDVENIGPLPVWDSFKEEILGRWEQELTKYELDLRVNEEVRNIVVRPEGGFAVTTSKGTTTCLRVVLGTGTRGNPRGIKVPGGDSDKVSYVLVDPDAYKGAHLMVVGGGDSAVEAAMALAQADPGNVVTVSYRRDTFGRIKPRNNERIMELVATGRIILQMETNPAEIRPDVVVLKRNDGELIEVKNDALFCMLGADPPVKWLQSIGIAYVKKPESWSPGPTDDLTFLELEREAS